MNGVAAACLAAGAVTAGWPAAAATRRLTGPAPVPLWMRAARWRRCWETAVVRRPVRALWAAVLLAAAMALLAGGAVAAVVAAVYAGLGGRALLRRSVRRREVLARTAAVDGLAALAADLRAGLAASTDLRAGLAASTDLRAGLAASAGLDPAVGVPGLTGRLGRLTSSAWRLAERTGAPVADLVERIEADARTADRAAASAAAQAAGAQATALLLAALPLGGIGLGVAIGADPVRVLLHTPIGGACAIGAVLLQGAGLLWADRLVAGVAR